MTHPASSSATMRTVRFPRYGEPADVIAMERVPVPQPAAARVRVAVHACGVNPADWALCRGLYAGILPRGIGLEVSGTVDAVGEGVTDVALGDPVFGTVDFAGGTSAGASDRAILNNWCRVPPGLDLVHAAALPMAVPTAYLALDALAVEQGEALVVHGAGTTTGFAAVQVALRRGARVIATAGPTYADRLRALGAAVTSYGEGMVARVLAMTTAPVDHVLDVSPPGGGVLPALVEIAGGVPRRVLTITDFAEAANLGVRNPLTEPGMKLRYDMLGEIAQLAAEGKFSIPVGRTFPLDDWRAAMEVSLGGQPRGKLLLLCGG